MGDGLDRVAVSVAASAAVPEDLVVLQVGEGVPDAAPGPSVGKPRRQERMPLSVSRRGRGITG